MSRFRKMTRQQRDVYQALRVLGEMVVTPNDARPLKALKRRGLITYRTKPVRIAVLRGAARTQRGPLTCAHASARDGDADEHSGLTVSAIHGAARSICRKERVQC